VLPVYLSLESSVDSYDTLVRAHPFGIYLFTIMISLILSASTRDGKSVIAYGERSVMS
jgi:hypothetical protein